LCFFFFFFFFFFNSSSTKGENWERFLPTFAKKTVARKKPKVVSAKKTYTPFPPAQQESKIDQQLESGEYFLNEQQRKARKQAEKMEKVSGHIFIIL
jgi:ribosomal RNA assembly protein